MRIIYNIVHFFDFSIIYCFEEKFYSIKYLFRMRYLVNCMPWIYNLGRKHMRLLKSSELYINMKVVDFIKNNNTF